MSRYVMYRAVPCHTVVYTTVSMLPLLHHVVMLSTLPCRDIPCYTVSMLHPTVPRHFTPCRTMPYHTLPFPCFTYYTMPRHVPYRAVPCHVPPFSCFTYYIMSRHVMYMSCHTVLDTTVSTTHPMYHFASCLLLYRVDLIRSNSTNEISKGGGSLFSTNQVIEGFLLAGILASLGKRWAPDENSTLYRFQEMFTELSRGDGTGLVAIEHWVMSRESGRWCRAGPFFGSSEDLGFARLDWRFVAVFLSGIPGFERCSGVIGFDPLVTLYVGVYLLCYGIARVEAYS